MEKEFKIIHQWHKWRTGKLCVADHQLPTPLVAHSAMVSRYLTVEQIRQTQTVALYLDPVKVASRLQLRELRALPNIKRLLGWSGLLVTRSGAGEIAKLAKPRGYKQGGVNFRLPDSGQLISFSPAAADEIQAQVGADISEQLYRDVNYYAPVDDLQAATEITGKWRKQSSASLSPITGGGLKSLHQQSISNLNQNSFGYVVTQAAQIDDQEELSRDLNTLFASLPTASLRVVPAQATFSQLRTALLAGADLIYTDLATHEAVMGNALIGEGKRLSLDHAHFANDDAPIMADCHCPVCQGRVSRAFLHYLARIEAPQYTTLLIQHNLFWLNQYVLRFRRQVENKKFVSLITSPR